MASYKPVGIDENGLLPPRAIDALGQVMLDIVNPNTILVSSGSNDSAAWQSAVDAVIDMRDNGDIDDDVVMTIKGISPTYTIGQKINVRGLRNTVITGSENGSAKISPATGRGSTIVFQVPAGPYSGVTENLTFENFYVDGNLVSEAASGVHDRRQDNVWGAHRITAFIHLNGNRVEGEEASGTVRNITIRNNRIHGVYSLPIHCRGVDGVRMYGNDISRSLDTGFIWCRGVIFTNNTVSWSADNGVSLSRGCTQSVVSNNVIEGSYYAGIHVGGFGADKGPDHVTVSSNTVTNSRQYGISAIDGSSHVTIVGNVVDGVLRGAPSDGNRDSLGDESPVVYGTGIVFGGLMTGENTPNATVTSYAAEVIVANNIVRNADRCGIIVKGGLRRANINGNIVTNIGSKHSVNGTTEISDTHNYYNVGIGIYAPSSGFISDVSVVGNQVVDTRSSPIIGRSYVFGSSGVSAGNYDSGVRTPNPAALTLRGSGFVPREIGFGVGEQELDFKILQSVDRLLKIVGRLSGNDNVSIQITRDGSIFLPSIEGITGVSPNVYITQAGELRKITG